MSFKDKVFVSFITTWAIVLLGTFLLANNTHIATLMVNCLFIVVLSFMAIINITTDFFKE